MNLLIEAKMVVPERMFYWENLRPDSCGFVAFGEGGNEHLQFTITPSKRVNVFMCLIYSALCEIVFIKKYYPCG